MIIVVVASDLHRFFFIFLLFSAINLYGVYAKYDLYLTIIIIISTIVILWPYFIRFSTEYGTRLTLSTAAGYSCYNLTIRT